MLDKSKVQVYVHHQGCVFVLTLNNPIISSLTYSSELVKVTLCKQPTICMSHMDDQTGCGSVMSTILTYLLSYLTTWASSCFDILQILTMVTKIEVPRKQRQHFLNVVWPCSFSLVTTWNFFLCKQKIVSWLLESKRVVYCK